MFLFQFLTSTLDATEQLQTIVDNIATQADELANEDVDPGVIRQYISELPDKLLHLGVKVVIAFIVIAICQQLIKLLLRIMRRSMERAKVEEATIQFVGSIIRVFLNIVLAFGVLAAFGMDTATIVALLGSAGVAIGLALQGSLSNIAGGILIMVIKPFRLGDYIVEENGGHEGTVTEIALFNTTLRTVDNRLVVVPNGNLSGATVINVSRLPERIMELKVSISYDSDLKLAKTVLEHEMRSCEMVMKDKPTEVHVEELGESGVTLLTRCWINPSNYRTVKWYLNEHYKLGLTRAGVKIPFPQMDVHIKNEE